VRAEESAIALKRTGRCDTKANEISRLAIFLNCSGLTKVIHQKEMAEAPKDDTISLRIVGTGMSMVAAFPFLRQFRFLSTGLLYIFLFNISPKNYQVKFGDIDSL
jgi:hypothetical protein